MNTSVFTDDDLHRRITTVAECALERYRNQVDSLPQQRTGADAYSDGSRLLISNPRRSTMRMHVEYRTSQHWARTESFIKITATHTVLVVTLKARRDGMVEYDQFGSLFDGEDNAAMTPRQKAESTIARLERDFAPVPA